MKKLINQTPDLTDNNIKKIAKLFPQVITEKEGSNGEIIKAIDFDLLKQELSEVLVDDSDERYRLDWPGKKASILKANTPLLNKTLRPIREDSVNFDNTENLYIEGDNFEVLKILQESYVNKIKMIYIDPPYNTGTAMIYNNDFSIDSIEYAKELGSISDDGVRMFKNTNTDGRIHSNWLSFMYERVALARDMLSNDGVICVTIDDYELPRLWMILDEIFGEENHLGTVAIRNNPKGRMTKRKISLVHEYAVFYAKSQEGKINKIPQDPSEKTHNYIKDEDGSWHLPVNLRKQGVDSAHINARGKISNRFYSIYYDPNSGKISTTEKLEIKIDPIDSDGNKRIWRRAKSVINKMYEKGELWAKKQKNGVQLYFKFRGGLDGRLSKSIWYDSKFSASEHGTKSVENLLNQREIFSYPKSPQAVMEAIQCGSKTKNAIVLDFFSGSATTAHTVMKLNAEDGGDRKFIMVQLPEETDKNSEAYKAEYKNICEIGKERIRRAGKKILEDNKEKLGERETPLDIGFRVFKVDSTNMKNVKHHPSQIAQQSLLEDDSKATQESLLDMVDNIKDDRSSEDLLSQVILSLGLELSLPIEKKDILGHEVFFVQQNSLIACFDENIDPKLVDEIAKSEPLKTVFRDSGFKDDKDRINIENRFKRLSPETEISVI
jgi:adenine-specific DNA-methyltransferase